MHALIPQMSRNHPKLTVKMHSTSYMLKNQWSQSFTVQKGYFFHQKQSLLTSLEKSRLNHSCLKNGCQSADGGKLTLLPSLHHKLHSKPADPLDNPWKTIQKGRWTPTVSLLTTHYVIGFVQLTWTLHVPLILLNRRPPDQTLYTLIPFKHYEYSNYDPCYISETA